MEARRSSKRQRSARAIFTLPQELLAELQQYADAVRGGNKSGFVADAVRAHIDHFRRQRHVARMREAYAASAKDAAEIARDWEPLSDEAWARLDALEKRSKRGR